MPGRKSQKAPTASKANSRHHVGEVTRKQENRVLRLDSPCPSLDMAGLQQITSARSSEQRHGPRLSFEDDFPVYPAPLALNPDKCRRERSCPPQLTLPLRAGDGGGRAPG